MRGVHGTHAAARVPRHLAEPSELRAELEPVQARMLTGEIKDSTGFELQAKIFRKFGFNGAAFRCEQQAYEARRIGE